MQFERALATQIILLAPIAPHFASELWSGFISAPNRLGSEIKWDKLVLEQDWPEVDMNYNLDLVCQVNGEENAIVKIPRKNIELLTMDEAVEIALKQNEVKEVLSDDRTIVKMSYNVYKGYDRVINIVTTSSKKIKIDL